MSHQGQCHFRSATVPSRPGFIAARSLRNNMVPWTTPVLISGFLTTGSFMGVVAQLCGLAAAMAVWLPFIRAYDKKCYREEQGLAA